MGAAARPLPSALARAVPPARVPAGLSPLQRLLAPEDHERLAQLVADLDGDLSAELGGFVEALTSTPAEEAPAAQPDPEGAAEAEPAGSDVAAMALEAIDWSAAIQLIRDVGGQVRRARSDAQEVARRARVAMQRSLAQAEAAETRMRAAEAASEAANRRALEAEAAAQAAEARAIRAEEALRAAESAKAEAEVWVRRLYSSIRTEFEVLSDDPVG